MQPLSFRALDPAIPQEAPQPKGRVYSLDLAELRNVEGIERVRQQMVVPLPQHTAKPPARFKGTCNKLKELISTTVHSTMDAQDYNGMRPYSKTIDQLNSGKSPREVRIDSHDEEKGSSCVGQSLMIMKNIKKEHNVDATLAVERLVTDKSPERFQDPKKYSEFNDFEHASALIQCSDGYVLLDPRSDPESRIYAIPFNATVEGKGFSITAAARGVSPPLTIDYKGEKGVHFEYYANVANGDDLVMKQYMIHSMNSFAPIVVYNKDGSTRKDIKISPSHSKVYLKDHTADKKGVPYTFEEIRKGGFLKTLEAFMDNDFHTSPQEAYDYILKFVSQEERMRTIFGKKPLMQKM